MITTLLSRLVILLFGTLYPAYASFKAVRTKNIKEYVKWMMYWIVFGIFIALETLSDIFLGIWVPFYYELKILFIFWLISPATQGSSYLYRRCVHPWLLKHESEIDSQIEALKRKSYGAIMQWGSHGFAYVSNIVMQTAVSGGANAIGFIKKSYSVNEMGQHTSVDHGSIELVAEQKCQVGLYNDYISDVEEYSEIHTLVRQRPQVTKKNSGLADAIMDETSYPDAALTPKIPKRTYNMRSVKTRPKSYIDDIDDTDSDMYEPLKNTMRKGKLSPLKDIYSSVQSLGYEEDLYPKSRLTKPTRNSVGRSQKQSMEQISTYATLPRRAKKKKTSAQNKEVKGYNYF